MDRRSFIGALAGLPIAAVVQPKVTRVTDIVTVESLKASGLDPKQARVFMNGVDVTGYKVMAAKTGDAGFIEFHARDTKGAIHSMGRATLPRVRLYGQVEVRVKAERPSCFEITGDQA